MKSDIAFPKVEKVGVCAIPEEKEGMKVWVIHILNLLEEELHNVLVSTKGYGTKNDEKVQTSQLRHYFENLAPHSARQVEIVPEDLTGLNNQYWVSFYIGSVIYDKKFIFLPDSLLHKNMIDLPVIKQKGILII